jgi:23S rRNA (adenine1618-N6)-methyltransferase
MTPKTNTEKTNLHPRINTDFRYDFKVLIEIPQLKSHVSINEHRIETIDFSSDPAVKSLNKALLISYYDIQNWDIQQLSLPSHSWKSGLYSLYSRFTSKCNNGIIPKGNAVQGLDIGVGANCIYPIGNVEYGWSFVGTDIDESD